MKTSSLVQRLRKPIGRPNPFSFGGGIKNGGLSDEAAASLAPLFDWDYMGYAQFEWGAVPAALQKIVNWVVAGELKEFTVESGNGPVHILCRGEDADIVAARVISWAQGEPEDAFTSIGLHASLSRGENATVVGWLELDNGFFFFIDREMAQKVAAFFDQLVAEETVVAEETAGDAEEVERAEGVEV